MRIRVTTAVVALALLTAACESDGDTEPRGSPTGPLRSQLEIGEVQSFIPATHNDGGKVAMSVNFPDGSSAEISYRGTIDIAGMGAQPYGSGGLPKCCGRDFLVMFGGLPRAQLAGDRPLKVYEGADGSPVEYWAVGASGHDPDSDRWLIFTFGKWNVLVWDDKRLMTDDQRAAWARSLRGEQTSDGFLRLSARSPLRLQQAGEHAGPQLLFSDGRDMVIFFLGDCKPLPRDEGKVVALGGKTGPKTDWFASRCFDNEPMRMHVQGEDKSFVQRVIDSVKVKNVELAS